MHHLMGAREVADEIGVSRQRVHQLLARDDFPRPTAMLASGPVWESAEVAAWAALQRATGRPRQVETQALPLDVLDGLPPHVLRPGAQVAGHDCRLQPAGGAWSVRCSCGWRERGDTRGEALNSGALHVRHAWPIMLPRQPNESGRDWAVRVQKAWLAADSTREEIWIRLGMGEPIQPGEEIPVMTPEYRRADDRCEVLANNMELAHAAMRQESSLNDQIDS